MCIYMCLGWNDWKSFSILYFKQIRSMEKIMIPQNIEIISGNIGIAH